MKSKGPAHMCAGQLDTHLPDGKILLTMPPAANMPSKERTGSNEIAAETETKAKNIANALQATNLVFDETCSAIENLRIQLKHPDT